MLSYSGVSSSHNSWSSSDSLSLLLCNHCNILGNYARERPRQSSSICAVGGRRILSSTPWPTWTNQRTLTINENYDGDTGNSDDGKRGNNEYDNVDVNLVLSSDADDDNIPNLFLQILVLLLRWKMSLNRLGDFFIVLA